MQRKMIQLHPLRAPSSDIPDDVLGNPLTPRWSIVHRGIWIGCAISRTKPQSWLQIYLREQLPSMFCVEAAARHNPRNRKRSSANSSSKHKSMTWKRSTYGWVTVLMRLHLL